MNARVGDREIVVTRGEGVVRHRRDRKRRAEQHQRAGARTVVDEKQRAARLRVTAENRALHGVQIAVASFAALVKHGEVALVEREQAVRKALQQRLRDEISVADQDDVVHTVGAEHLGRLAVVVLTRHEVFNLLRRPDDQRNTRLLHRPAVCEQARRADDAGDVVQHTAIGAAQELLDARRRRRREDGDAQRLHGQLSWSTIGSSPASASTTSYMPSIPKTSSGSTRRTTPPA